MTTPASPRLARFVLRLALAVIASAGIVSGGRAAAQANLWNITGDWYAEGLGASVSYCDDVDGDGKPDLLLGALPYRGESGKVFVYSSAGYHPMLLEFDGDAQGDGFGSRVGALGDVDGDGLGDYAIAAPTRNVTGSPLGAVGVASGAGGWIHVFMSASNGQTGLGMVVLGDVDGDGVRDLLFNELTSTYTVFVTSGASGATIRTHTSSAPSYGAVLGAVGDADADGVDDYAICDLGGPSGDVNVYSGASGALLFSYAAAPTWVRTAGDTDADGAADLLLSQAGSGVVEIVSGKTGAQLHALTFRSDPTFGRSGSTFGDFDGDGKSDVVATREENYSDPTDPETRLQVFSGATGLWIADFDADGYELVALDASADADGDGIHDLLAADRYLGGLVSLVPGSNGFPTRIRGGYFESYLGQGVAAVGDRDGDGWRDVAVNSPGGLDMPSSATGVVQIVSGRDGHELSRFLPVSRISSGYGFTSIVPVGDVDGDGVEDLAGAGYQGVEIHSGADDSLLSTIVPPSGPPIDLAAAAETDGTPLLAISTSTNLGGNFYVYDLTSGSIVTQVINFCGAATCMGDVDQDGRVDWLKFDVTTGSVSLLSGGTATGLWSYGGTGRGVSMASVHDLNGDGVDDALVGKNFPEKVDVVSGVDGKKLYEVTDSTPYTAFGSLASLGDLDQDGYGDFAVGAARKNADAGAIVVFSGRAGTRLYRFDGTQPSEWLGQIFAKPRWHEERSLDPDGIPDLVSGSPSFNHGLLFDPLLGRAHAWRLDDLYLQILPPIVTAGQAVSLITRGGRPAGVAGLFALDWSGVPLGYFLALGTFDGNGNFAVNGTVPAGLAGHTLTAMSFGNGNVRNVVDTQAMTLEFQ